MDLVSCGAKKSRGGSTAVGIREAVRWLPGGMLVGGDTICGVFIIDPTARL